MNVLAIDTSTKFLSVAILNNDSIIAAVHEKTELSHSSLLIPAIDKALNVGNLTLKDMEALAVSIGPGSFTGLRIGVVTCKAINLALGTPIITVPTLDAIAYNFIKEERFLCPLVDAKKKKVYACFYEVCSSELKRTTDYLLTDIDSVLAKIHQPTLFFGDGLDVYGDYCKKNKNPFVRISEGDWIPKAETVGRLSLGKAKKKQFVNPDKLIPLYLHSKYCQVKSVMC